MIMLSGLTRSAGVVATTKESARLKHVEFVRIEPERALAVLVAEDGSVENRILQIAPGLPPSALWEASNYLNARIRNRTLQDVKNEIEVSHKLVEAELGEFMARLVDVGIASWAESAEHGSQLIVRGQANLL